MPQRQRPLVLHIITRVIVGGAQLTVLETCAGLKDTYDFHVICGPQEGVEGTIRPRLENVASVTVLSELRREINPLADFRAMGRMRRELRRVRPAVVHTHSSKAGILGRQAAASEGLAAVHTIHGWGHTPNDLWFKHAAFVRLERRAARQAQALVAVSEDVRDEGLRYGIGERHQYRVIPECVDYRPLAADFDESRRVARAALGLKPDASVVGWVGRFVPQKDPETLASALGIVLTKSSTAVAVQSETVPYQNSSSDASPTWLWRIEWYGRGSELTPAAFTQPSTWSSTRASGKVSPASCKRQ